MNAASKEVVYLLIPTSNHNHSAAPSTQAKLYIFWFLHQTTTTTVSLQGSSRCISFDSYIKPQLEWYGKSQAPVVYLLIPTSNHNKERFALESTFVVYLLIPTSNHNARAACNGAAWVVYLLISTSNHNHIFCSAFIPWVVYLLIPTSNHNLSSACNFLHALYIFWFLHQTTTNALSSHIKARCISFDSYIKPQPRFCLCGIPRVVYLLIPTSNHNYY